MKKLRSEQFRLMNEKINGKNKAHDYKIIQLPIYNHTTIENNKLIIKTTMNHLEIFAVTFAGCFCAISCMLVLIRITFASSLRERKEKTRNFHDFMTETLKEIKEKCNYLKKD
ncbi:MAG: hypothetical protein Pg6B_09400 [Candidatus Azobacteroides pseudotrichonymphae]|nr:MAG: hypothetical protein Pg6B_09400 [Candidatus Azobacteroides pseudotrichonymphae]